MFPSAHQPALFFTQAGTPSAVANGVIDPASKIAEIAIIVAFIDKILR
jgi:hypothetical protein